VLQYSNPAAPNLQHTTNREQNNRCGNSTAQSQALDDGYMFRTLIYPSSGACDCAVELPHRSFCSRFVVSWRFGYINIRNMLST